jgi:hypothetical protein
MQTRILEEDPGEVDQESNLSKALAKWERKSVNSLQKGKGAQVDFESVHVPDAVNEVIFGKLGACKTKAHTQEVFSKFKE